MYTLVLTHREIHASRMHGNRMQHDRNMVYTLVSAQRLLAVRVRVRDRVRVRVRVSR